MIPSRKTTWVLVANAAEAQVWVCEGNDIQRRLTGGRFYNPFCGGAEAEPAKVGTLQFDAHVTTTQIFAQMIAEYLDRAARKNLFSALVLAAPEDLLQALRMNFQRHTVEQVIHSLARDLTHLSTVELTPILGTLVGRQPDSSRSQ